MKRKRWFHEQQKTKYAIINKKYVIYVKKNLIIMIKNNKKEKITVTKRVKLEVLPIIFVI